MPTNQYLATHVESNAHSSEIFSLAVTPSRVISASGDPVIKIWDAKSEYPLIHELADAHRLGVHHLAVDIDNGGTTIASAGFEHELALWDLQEGKERVRVKPEALIENSNLDGEFVVEFPANEGSKFEGRSRVNMGEAWALSLSPEGKILYTTTYDGRVVLWDTSSLKTISEIETKGSFGTCISGDRRFIASGHQNGGIYVFSTETNRILYTLPGTSKTVRSLSFSPGSNYLAVAGDSKVISIYDVQHGEQIANLSGHSSPLLSVDWNRTGQLLLSSSLDGRVKVWDFEQRAATATQTESNSTIWSAKWQRSSDGFITGGAEKSLYWYIAAGV